MRKLSQTIHPIADWRVLSVAVILTAALLPTVWLTWSSFTGPSLLPTLGPVTGPFFGAIRRSLWLIAAVAIGACALGWPTGTLLGLVGVPGRRVFLAFLAIPLFTPSFLWAIGMSSCRPLLAYRHQWWFDGFPGVVLTGVVQGVPLVVFATLLAVRTLPASQLDAARLAGGFGTLIRASARFSFPAAFGGATLAGILALADPGPAQIMGYHGIASEILIAFSARYDAGLAATKALVMGLVLLPLLLAVSWKIATWSQSHLLGRDVRQANRVLRGLVPQAVAITLCVACLVLLLPAFIGLIRPLRPGVTADSFHSAWAILNQSAGTTVRYGLTAAATATIMAVMLNLSWGSSRSGRLSLCLLSFLLLSLPPSLHALGFAGLASQLPSFFDPLTRSGNAVGIALGLRLLPIPVLFWLRGWSALPASRHHAAAVHGVPFLLYHWRVTMPQLLPTILASFLVVVLISIADVSSTLLLLPPGASTFTTRIFGVIDNTSERILSALCVIYIAAGFLLLVLFALAEFLWHRHTANSQ
jgi:iron(III) transport system permease protein